MIYFLIPVYMMCGLLTLMTQVFQSKTSEELTFLEGFITVIIWPLIALFRIADIFVKNFFKILNRI